MPKSVYSNTTAVLTLEDGTTYAVKADKRFSATDPVVREHPWAFSDSNGTPLDDEDRPRRGRRPNVEQATAAPGELRDL